MSKPITLKEILGIQYPIIVAPMFLISNEEMVVSALENGATAAIPALNYRTTEELKNAIRSIKKRSSKPFGINLIVNNSNLKYRDQLNVLIEEKIAYIITSLGNPKEVIEKCQPIGIKVFCDVVDLKYAQKVEALGADAIIAVNNKAGGHAGPKKAEELILELSQNCKTPIISAGGVGTGKQAVERMKLPIAGLSIGTIFLASEEAKISSEYRQALIDYGEKDIVLNSKLSGSPLTVINTPYVQEMGNKKNFLEWLMYKSPRLKKIIKLIIAVRGMQKVKNAAQKATYKTVWCAGPTIEHIHAIRPLKDILNDITSSFDQSV
jgi:nitronate monooxygenase